MRKTTEKSLEINVLRHLVNCLEQKTGNKITVIAPTQKLEERLGYDEIIQGLPKGLVIALQFKRPDQETGFVKFRLNVPQMKTMHRLFPKNCAFYVFPLFPTHLELINEYDQVLNKSLAIDVRNVSSVVVKNKKSSVVKFFQNRNMRVLDNRERHNLESFFPLSDFCHIHSSKMGMTTDKFKKIMKSPDTIMEKIEKSKLEINFLHIAEK